ncbi:DUF6241 domain-containing protein [Ureibacillus chungkukjangi]|uniref:Uncharacterized protein n=1 Tax=Ureibacillus chungkukjangi TaxID=1202712 RepID=A0A318U126_9BACL|nr:DUF6241 domain-containing protein [Ureibacillus chungkukjangi]PYF08948.1 hypothetical protein BJ095_101169 [Ureibacillus chungkukjangi]
MKKTLIIFFIIVGVLAIGVGVYYLSKYLNEPSEEEILDAQEQIEEEFKTAEVDMPEDDKLDLKIRFPDDLAESNIQDIIHGMSHQKVAAEQKWGEYQITQERVERLLEVAILNKEKYISGDAYVSILEKWVQGDFSNAVLDHNYIWSLQGGNVGEATRLLTPVEEKAYIESHFKK